MINTQENSNLNATITTEVNGVDTPALTVNTSLNSSLNNCMININIINQDVCKNNAADLQQQLTDFITNQVKTKMTTMGYPITF